PPGEPVPRMVDGHPVDALDLRLPGRVPGAALRLHAGRLSGADRCRRGCEPPLEKALQTPRAPPEEAPQTLRADRWATFSTVSLPLMRPGLANAFLVGFIESIADFGNPIVLGGDYGVLSPEIYFAVVGAQLDY